MRPMVVLPLLASVVVCLGGCGSSGSAPTTTTQPAATAEATLTPEGAPGSVSASVGSAIPLGISPVDLERKIGSPAVPLRPVKGGYECSLYLMTEQPAFVKLRYCFRHERLKFFSTYAVEGH